MDITSFSLGISFAVVVGMLAVTVYNLFRVQKINKELRSLHEMFTDDIRRSFSIIDENKTIATTENETIWREIRVLNSNLDSRLDKLIHRLDRLERERLSTTRDDAAISAAGRVDRPQKQLLND
jgi:outer membrane lipopolysaccharide assembly protein LptE/RlpB